MTRGRGCGSPRLPPAPGAARGVAGRGRGGRKQPFSSPITLLPFWGRFMTPVARGGGGVPRGRGGATPGAGRPLLVPPRSRCRPAPTGRIGRGSSPGSPALPRGGCRQGKGLRTLRHPRLRGGAGGGFPASGRGAAALHREERGCFHRRGGPAGREPLKKEEGGVVTKIRPAG